MKKLFTIICCFACLFAKAQCSIPFGVNGFLDLSFDSSCYRNLVVIDTVNYHHNIWQVGKPHKATFDTTLSPPNALVTDTLNPYPANDTSVVYLKIPMANIYPARDIRFKFRTDVNPQDSLFIDMSADTLLNWKRVGIDTLPYSFYLFTPFDLHDSAAGWQPFILDRGWPPPTYLPETDTVLMRFTFISASTVTGRDGWIIDTLQVFYNWEGAAPQLHNNPNLFSFYPNPSRGNIYLHSTLPADKATITIYNMLGQQVYQQPAPHNGNLNLNLPNGIYTLRYDDDEEYCVKQLMIQH